MFTACVVLFLLGILGAFDIAYFHTYKARLCRQPASRLEAWVHVVRGIVYAAQFAIVPNVRLHGAYYMAFIALFVVDVAVAAFDIAIEPSSRKSLGGLEGGEYAMHMLLSVLAGVFLHALFASTFSYFDLPTAIVFEPQAPRALRIVLGLMAIGSFCVALAEATVLMAARSEKPRPIHVSVRLRTTCEALWHFTQDHLRHPDWDHRFSRIEMLSPTIGQGTRMIYEKSIGPFTVRGWGHYKLHRPFRQSTFEFGSDDPRSLIRRGVGLWLYRPRPGGIVEFSTSYTYEVRWGMFGRVLDRFVFRPLFQWETERSFRRLARDWFPEGASPVHGASGRKPLRFAEAL